MYFKFTCPNCGKNLKSREEHVGRRVGCPYCKTTVTVTSPAEAPESSPESPLPEIDAGQAGYTADRSRRRPAPAREHRTQGVSTRWSQGTDVHMVLSGLLGIVMAVGFYSCAIPIRGYYLGELFLERGWVPYVLVFLLTWSVAILVLKWRKHVKQKATMLFDLIPTEIANEITVDNLEEFIDHVRSLPVDPGESFLINRVRRGLEHFRVRKSSSEVSNILTSQSEIDATAVESSYTLLKVFIWAIPILGFIGTVIGISAAVGGFSGSLDAAEDIGVLKESLNNVTGGLATAFDTTLIALAMSLIVMFPTSSLQKMEEDLLNWVDEYCNENLLKRLNDGRMGGSERGSGFSPAARRQMEDLLASQQVELEQWTQKLEAIGETLTQQVLRGWSQVNEQVRSDDQQRQKNLAELEQGVARLQQTLADIGQQSETASRQFADALEKTHDHADQLSADLRKGLTGLTSVLEDLGQKQVVVQQVEQKSRKRRWFFRGNDKKG